MPLPLKDSLLAGTLRQVPGSQARLPPAPGRTQERTPMVVWAQPMQLFQGTADERASLRWGAPCLGQEETLLPALRGGPDAMRHFPIGSPRALQRTQLKGTSRRSLHLKCPKHSQGLALQKLFRYRVSPHPTLRELEPHSSFLERSPQALMSFSDEAPKLKTS